MKQIIFFLIALGLALHAHAEEQVQKQGSAQKLKAFVGFGGGNSLIARDGTVWIKIESGLQVNSHTQIGLYASTIVSDIKNPYKKDLPQYIDYNALGLFGEFTILKKEVFSLSIPVSAGAGVINIMKQNVEHSKAEDGFFVAEAGLSFNCQLTQVLRISLAGGWRQFLDIDNNKLSNKDFNTLFGEISFRWTE